MICQLRYLFAMVGPNTAATTWSEDIMDTARKEQRGSARRRVLKGAIILCHDRRSALPCTVRDLSATGARLRVESAVTVPKQFILVVELDGVEADCEIVYRRAKEVGVRFVSPMRGVRPIRMQIVKAPK